MIIDMPASARPATQAKPPELGQSAPNPVVSTLRSFAEEYRAHIEDHKCPAGVCGAQPVGEAV